MLLHEYVLYVYVVCMRVLVEYVHIFVYYNTLCICELIMHTYAVVIRLIYVYAYKI